jgi:hypothetical protein
VAQSALVVQPPQVFVDGLHTGIVDVQLALLPHCTQVLVVVLQTGVVPEQSPLPAQRTHAPVAALQAGVDGEPEQSPLVAQGPHTPAMQRGAEAVQSLPVRHCTHTSRVVSHSGVEPPHCALLVHCTQVWLPALQAGVTITGQSPSTTHRTHWPLEPSVRVSQAGAAG